MAEKVKKYKCVFFDLDHTLWDYEKNSDETLAELYDKHRLQSLGVTTVDAFCSKFREVNLRLWDQFDTGQITGDVIRKERFKQILDSFGAYEQTLSAKLSEEYLTTCPTKSNLIPGAHEILEYLLDHYKLTVITNGFEEIQNIKLTSGRLHRYFNYIITSEKAGHRKPAKGIFEYALRVNDVSETEAIMIGDNLLTDIGGARNAMIDSVFFNPERFTHDADVPYEISSLSELREIL